MTKQELARLYGISPDTLRKLLNKRYFEILKEVGYIKESNYINPKVVLKFYEIYGEPINDNDE